MLKIKLLAAFAFLAIVAGVFLLSGDRSQAQTGKVDGKRDGVLGKIAGYKAWKQVQKPEVKPQIKVEDPAKTDVLTISDSAPAG